MNIIDDDIERIRTRFGAIKWALDERLRYLGTGNGLGWWNSAICLKKSNYKHFF